MVLYVFITHQKNLAVCYDRIANMMGDNFVVVQGGFLTDSYNPETRILNLNCQDGYVGLPEKVMKAFHFLLGNSEFQQYTHFCKLDDDMLVVKKFESITEDYLGVVYYQEGNRQWHIGRCGGVWDKIPYLGEFVPWCLGGFGYVVSRAALTKITPNHNYLGHVYEDLYLALELNKVGIYPKSINIKEWLVSPDHL